MCRKRASRAEIFLFGWSCLVRFSIQRSDMVLVVDVHMARRHNIMPKVHQLHRYRSTIEKAVGPLALG